MKINRGYIVTAILSVKSKYLNEKYVTLEECNFFEQMLKLELDKMGIVVNFGDKLDLGYFNVKDGVVFRNNDISVNGLLHKYVVPEYISIIYDDDFGINVLKEFYSEDSERLQKLQETSSKKLRP